MTKMLLKYNEFCTQRLFTYLTYPSQATVSFNVLQSVMCSHRLRVLGLPEDLQEVIIGEEVEPREALPLGLKIHVQ